MKTEDSLMKPIPLEEQDLKLVRVFRALGHPARLKIVRLLAERDSCICGEIVDELPLAQATVSQHLKVLKEAGIVVGTTEGPATCYCLAPDTVSFLRELVAKLSADLARDSSESVRPFVGLEAPV